MSEDFPKDFNLVVVGTGLTESIIAAAASRIGKTVLHLDKNDYYGGYGASFNLEALLGHVVKVPPTYSEPVFETADGLKIIPDTCHIEQVDLKWSEEDGPAEQGEEEEKELSPKEKLLKASRHFNIDLSPTLLYSLGAMVKLLISSNICRYAEFRAIDRVATLIGGEVKTVPCSRSDVFVTTEVNVVEKRIMMKLMETCMELCDKDSAKSGEENEEKTKTLAAFKDKTFHEFLLSMKAPPKVLHYLMNTISMANKETAFGQGLISLKKFVESLGRYGNSPFLFPMYGCGEIPQCFCRLCAVFGGIYCLQRGIKEIKAAGTVDTGKLSMKLETDEEISVGNIVFGPSTMRVSTDKVQDEKAHLARGVLIVDKPLKDTNEKPKGGGVEFLRLTTETKEAYLIQLSHYSGCCPKDVFLYHFITTTADGKESPREALSPFIEQVLPKENNGEKSELSEEKLPKVLFEMFFTIPIIKNQYQLAPGIHLAGGPSFALDYDSNIEEARDLFQKLYPGEEFLPRAPEPEEIIMEGYDDKDDSTVAQGDQPTEETLPTNGKTVENEKDNVEE